MPDLTPVTVLTGFLGAGKTTLLNRLLRRPELANSLVLVNEFGEIGVDHLLVRKLDETTVLLNAGCLCCTVRGDLSRVLREWLPRARRGEIARVVVETTGLADPIPILGALAGDSVVASAYRLDGVITVIDAVNGAANLARFREAARQAAVADRLVISKTDLADPASLLAGVRALNPGAPLVLADAAEPGFLLDAGLGGAGGKTADVAAWMAEAAHEDHHHHGHDPGRHGASIRAFVLHVARRQDWTVLSHALGQLLAAHGAGILRIKGVLRLTDEEAPVALHAVGHLLHPPLRLPSDTPMAGDGSLVFIVDGLARDIVARALGHTGISDPNHQSGAGRPE